MHIITQKRIWEAQRKYPKCKSSLEQWYRIVKKNNFTSFSDIQKLFPSTDKVGKYYIFDIGGNTLRLIANCHFQYNKLYIREILSNREYDKNKWKK
jgi:mRNA interferase HigB